MEEGNYWASGQDWEAFTPFPRARVPQFVAVVSSAVPNMLLGFSVLSTAACC